MPTITSYTTKCDLTAEVAIDRSGRRSRIITSAVTVTGREAIGIVNVWAALHYLLGCRTLRQDLEATERLATA